MEHTIPVALILYIVGASLLGAGLTVYDKIAAKALPRYRIPEKTLFFAAVLGGAAAMYVTMRLARHKTRHKKFMVGLPVVIGCHAAMLLAHYLLCL